MKLSLILATIARTTEVGRCLRSLAAQTDPDFEILLVDQNQDDRLLPFVQEAASLGLRMTHLRMAVASLSGARNLGIANAQGDVIGLTDDDCWYEQDAIRSVKAALSQSPPVEGVVAQWVEQANARSDRPSSAPLSLAAWRKFRGGDASSITLFFKRELLIQLGGFDERFGVGKWFGAAEETDFVLRALASGATLRHCPEAKVHHLFALNTNGPLATVGQGARRRARGTGGIYAKHKLGAWTIARGCIAPVVKPLMQGKLNAALVGFYISLGRIEGFAAWKLGRYT